MNIYKDILCPHFSVCSGCIINKNADEPPLLKEIQLYFKNSTVPFDYYSDRMIEWRDRAKLAVRGTSQNPQIGLYEKGTHQVVNIPLCRVHHPLINRAVEIVKNWIKVEKIEPYDEITQKGLLRYIQCVVERGAGAIQLVLVLNASNENAVGSRISRLWQAAPELWNSIWVNLNQTATNTIFGSTWKLMQGSEFVCDTLAGIKVFFHPANFGQANLTVFEKMLRDLREQLNANQRVVEYYAGVGVIGLSLADKSKVVKCCEINPFAEVAFKKACSEQNFQNIYFYEGSAVDHLNLLDECDLVIVDPPRKGLDKPLLKALLENKDPQELWYVSCGWDSFKKDCEELKKEWQLKNVKGYLFFPGTDHVEILAHFEKK